MPEKERITDMVTRFLDYLDESAAGIIRVAYLAAGVIAVASYFADGSQHIPAWLAGALVAILPWVLAGALEIHTYLTARRVRRAHQDMAAATPGSDEHERGRGALTLNLWILAGLLVFSMYNQLQYLAQTWTPPTTPLTPPGFWPYLIRAAITPAAFMAAAFLAPVGEGMAARVQQEASYLTTAAFKAAARQWKTNLRQMQRNNQDITAALVHLVDDPREQRVIGTIWQAMHPGEVPPGTLAPTVAVPALAPPTSAPEPEPEPPSPAPHPPTRPRVGQQQALQLVTPPEWREPARLVRADSGRTRAEQQALWERDSAMAGSILADEPGISTRELARRLSVGRATVVHAQRADKVRRTLQPERGRTLAPVADGNVQNVHPRRRRRRRVVSGPSEASA